MESLVRRVATGADKEHVPVGSSKCNSAVGPRCRQTRRRESGHASGRCYLECPESRTLKVEDVAVAPAAPNAVEGVGSERSYRSKQKKIPRNHDTRGCVEGLGAGAQFHFQIVSALVVSLALTARSRVFSSTPA